MWQAYPSIDDMNDVDRIRRHSVGAGDYVAVEKVDGSNFALEFNGEGVLYYSRNKQVSYDGYFVGKVKPWDAMHVYHEAVSQLFDRILPLEAQKAEPSPRIHWFHHGAPPAEPTPASFAHVHRWRPARGVIAPYPGVGSDGDCPHRQALRWCDVLCSSIWFNGRVTASQY